MLDPERNFNKHNQEDGFDYDLIPILREEGLIARIKREGYIEFQTFEEVEVGYHLILLHNNDARRHISGILTVNNLGGESVKIEREGNIFQRLFAKKYVFIARAKEKDYKIYGCSGDFSNFDDLLKNFSKES